MVFLLVRLRWSERQYAGSVCSITFSFIIELYVSVFFFQDFKRKAAIRFKSKKISFLTAELELCLHAIYLYCKFLMRLIILVFFNCFVLLCQCIVSTSTAYSCRPFTSDYDVHISNSLQDIRQNHWTVKYRSC